MAPSKLSSQPTACQSASVNSWAVATALNWIGRFSWNKEGRGRGGKLQVLRILVLKTPAINLYLFPCLILVSFLFLFLTIFVLRPTKKNTILFFALLKLYGRHGSRRTCQQTCNMTLCYEQMNVERGPQWFSSSQQAWRLGHYRHCSMSCYKSHTIKIIYFLV